MGGVGERALLRFLSDSPNIKTVYLCLDSDRAGSEACTRLNALIPDTYAVNRLVLPRTSSSVRARANALISVCLICIVCFPPPELVEGEAGLVKPPPFLEKICPIPGAGPALPPGA